MNTRILPILAAASAMVMACSARAETPFSAGVHAGTTGVGVDGQFRVNDIIAIRIASDWLSYSRNFSSSDLSYSGKATWSTVGVFGDLHPFKNGFMLSGGADFGDRKVTLIATPAGNVVVNGVTLTPGQIGHLKGEGKLSGTAPFGGIGWDSTHTSKGGLGFRALIGVAFSDNPRISLIATGPAANTPTVQSALQTYIQTQQQQVQHDARILKTYPVASLGLAYRF